VLSNVQSLLLNLFSKSAILGSISPKLKGHYYASPLDLMNTRSGRTIAWSLGFFVYNLNT
jgi:hypothetical protein